MVWCNLCNAAHLSVSFSEPLAARDRHVLYGVSEFSSENKQNIYREKAKSGNKGQKIPTPNPSPKFPVTPPPLDSQFHTWSMYAIDEFSPRWVQRISKVCPSTDI